MIIAVDYDGTLEIEGKINLPLIAKLKRAQKCGDLVILWTCRDGKRLQEAVMKLRTAGFVPNVINDNIQTVVQRFGYNPRKVFADIYIDDKAAR